MTRIYVCPECGQFCGHFAGCPEDVWPDDDDAGPDDDEGDEQQVETPDEFQTMANIKISQPGT